MTTTKNRTLARRFVEVVVNRRQVERIPEFVALGFRDRTSGPCGVNGYRQHAETSLHCYPDIRMRIRGQVAEGDWLVTGFEAAGTHLGEWQEVQPTGKRPHLKGVNIDRVRNGRIVEHWGTANILEAMLEMGAVRWVKCPQRSRRAKNSKAPAAAQKANS